MEGEWEREKEKILSFLRQQFVMELSKQWFRQRNIGDIHNDSLF